MNYKININSIIRVLMILLFCSFTVFETSSWGLYVILFCIALIFFFHAIRDNLKYRFVLGIYPEVIILFTIYTLMSSIWAMDASDAITKGITMFEILLMVIVLYNCCRTNQHSVCDILKVIKWSGFIISVYSILYYGIDTLILMSEAELQLENSYTNINTIGMLASIATLIQIDEMVADKKIKLTSFLCVPMVGMVALTQSRKAFVVLVVGIFLILILRNINSKNFFATILKIIFILTIVGIVLYFILSLPIFSGLMNRMEGLIANFTGMGKVDNSTRIRTKMIAVGLEQFKKTPILGVGIGNPHHLAAKYIGKDTYLHNNFVELLAGGGIIGFTIYYSMYIYLFVSFWRYRKYKNKEYTICFIIMFLLLAMDYGMVSYYNKGRHIYLMMYFLEVEQLKKNARQSIQGRCIEHGN